MNALSRLLARSTFLRWMALLGLMLGAASSALAAKTYSDNGDGTVTDPTTGLQWMRCSVGQTWDGATATCTGTASTYRWAPAVALTNTVPFAGQSDWRLPTMRELQTIVDRSVYNPAIDKIAFPNTAPSVFWSASASAGNSSSAWYVDFYDGYERGYDKLYIYQVRLVRAGQSFGLLDITRPSTDYVDQGNGTVLHTPTGLIWQRCAVGQTWADGACSGDARAFDGATAQVLTSSFAGQSDWRLPTEEELLSLVDYGKYGPAINTTQFPNTPATVFWSASAHAGYSGGAWYVFYNDGSANGYSKSSSFQVRLVRAGQPFGAFALNVATTGPGAVSSSGLAGIDCGATCAGSYTAGTRVILHATPAANLVTWGGACLSAGTAATCTVTMDAVKNVSASFVDVPVITGLPSTLAFNPQNIGSTSATQHATLVNTGTGALLISNIAATGDYTVLHNCNLAPTVVASCTLDVSFSPVAAGTRTGTVTITNNAPGSPQSITLNGTGLGGVWSPSRTALVFAGQKTGTTSSSQSITLSNIGGAVINISSIVANGNFGRTTTCSATLAPGSNCVVSVTFSPLMVGAHVSSLVINSDASNNPQTINLSGTGIAAPGVTLSPTSLSFPAQIQGTASSQRSITLSNPGTAKLTFSSVLSNSLEFALWHNCGTGPEAGAFCALNVTFTPSTTGFRSGVLTIASNAPGSPHSVNVSGTGTSLFAPICTLSATPASIRKDGSSNMTATCSPAADTYAWTGGTCQGTTGPTCTVTPAATTTYGVTGTNPYGSSTAAVQVTVKAVDLTPILMLLLD